MDKRIIIICILMVLVICGCSSFDEEMCERNDNRVWFEGECVHPEQAPQPVKLDLFEQFGFNTECYEEKTIEKKKNNTIINMDCYLDKNKQDDYLICSVDCEKKLSECIRKYTINDFCYDGFYDCKEECIGEYKRIARVLNCLETSITKWNETICTKEILVRDLE